MRTRQLGDQTVTAIGGGELSLATSAGRGIAAGDVARALHEAIDLGLMLFDLAPEPDGERLAGDAVREHRARDRVVLATRVPLLDERPGPPGRDSLRERLPAAHLQHRVEAALRATRLEVLPLVQLPLRPAWRGSPAWPELVGTCARLVREGKALAWGALLDEPADEAAPALLAEPWLAAVSVIYNVWARAAEPLFEAATKRGLAILARQPLAGGALAGRLGPGAVLFARDDRRALDAAALERIAVAVARLAPLVKREPAVLRASEAAKKIAETTARPEHLECLELAELALRFAIDRAGIALPRLHRREHLPTAIGAALAPPLSPGLIDRILDAAAQCSDAQR